MSPRRAQGGPRSGPRVPKTGPRAARSAPRGAHNHPGAPQERTQGAPSRPDASREPFGRSFWPHLGAPGASFSSLLRPFSSFARDPLDKRSHSSNKPVVTGQQCDALANLLVACGSPPPAPLRARATCLSTAPAPSAGPGPRRFGRALSSARLDTSGETEAVCCWDLYVCACFRPDKYMW